MIVNIGQFEEGTELEIKAVNDSFINLAKQLLLFFL